MLLFLIIAIISNIYIFIYLNIAVGVNPRTPNAYAPEIKQYSLVDTNGGLHNDVAFLSKVRMDYVLIKPTPHE